MLRYFRGSGWSRLRLTLFLTGLILVLAPVAALAQFTLAQFTDVPATHTHYEGISWVDEKGITTGYADGTYRPENPVTRGQMATFLYRNAGVLVAAGATVVNPALIADPLGVKRWFNNVNGQAPTFTKVDTGKYELDFGFDLSDRFVQVTSNPPSLFIIPGPPVTWSTASVSGTKVRVYTYYFDGNVPQFTDGNVHILIY